VNSIAVQGRKCQDPGGGWSLLPIALDDFTDQFAAWYLQLQRYPDTPHPLEGPGGYINDIRSTILISR
jgi:hypothetical protein